MEEIWKDVTGYPGYQVSNLGRIRTHNKISSNGKHDIRHWKDRIMKPKVSKKDKCTRVELWKDGKHKTFLLCRLIANEFIDPLIDTEMTVNHKDGNRLNNKAENLEWLTREDNIRHGFRTGLYPTKGCCLCDSDGNDYFFRSLSEGSRFLGKSNGYLSNCLKKGRIPKDVYGKVYFVTF